MYNLPEEALSGRPLEIRLLEQDAWNGTSTALI